MGMTASRAPGTEDRLQAATVAQLRALLPPDWIVAHIPNGGRRGRAEAAILKTMGVVPGMPDLLLIGPHPVLLMVEMKTAGGRPSAAQTRIHAALGRLGWPVIVARSIEDILPVLTDAGVPLRGSIQSGGQRDG